MDQPSTTATRPRAGQRAWIVIVGIIIILIFLYFYQPFENYLIEGIKNIHAYNIIFWFTSLVGIVGYAVAHWQSFRQYVFRQVNELEAEALVFDSLQIALLVAVIFCAGGTLQAVVVLSGHLLNQGAIMEAAFGRTLLSVVLLVILAIAFYLLHRVVRAFRVGWRPKRPPGRQAP